MGRYFLHAELSVVHPKTNAILNFKSPLPVELQTLLSASGIKRVF
jgi:hypothetical protein